MTDVLKLIQSRRSIRKYADALVDDKQVETLLRAAMSAPSAGNEQPWEFVVIRDEATRAKIVEFHAHGKPVVDAALGILVCGDMNRVKYDEMWVQDCSAAVENLLIAARGIGLGTCWIGIYPREERMKGMAELCELPDNVTPFALIAVGVPDENKGLADYYDAERVHHETF